MLNEFELKEDVRELVLIILEVEFTFFWFVLQEAKIWGWAFRVSCDYFTLVLVFNHVDDFWVDEVALSGERLDCQTN